MVEKEFLISRLVSSFCAAILQQTTPTPPPPRLLVFSLVCKLISQVTHTAMSNRRWSCYGFLCNMLSYLSCLSYRSKNEQDLERSHDMLQRELRALLELEG